MAAQARPVTAERIIAADQEPQNWLAHGRTYGEQRYSPLKQINDGNVGQLGLAWDYATGTTRGLQATPIVVDGRMYATGVWSVVYALDAKTGKDVFVEKPLVHSLWEARTLQQLAVKKNLVTQMGNQGHAFEGALPEERFVDEVLKGASGLVVPAS